MIHFVGAGPGAVDLITLRGQRLLCEASLVVYAGSLVNPALLACCKPDCVCLDSARMTLGEVIDAMCVVSGTVVRLHTGDPSIYGAIREQMDALRRRGVPFEVVPGVSSLFGAAAALEAEFTLPGVTQTLIVSRMAGRTPVPERESIRSLAAHGATMALFLSSGMLHSLAAELMAGGYGAETPAAVAYKASWPEQKILRGTVSSIADMAAAEGITSTALVLVGWFLGDDYELSKLYDPSFAHGFREATRP